MLEGPSAPRSTPPTISTPTRANAATSATSAISSAFTNTPATRVTLTKPSASSANSAPSSPLATSSTKAASRSTPTRPLLMTTRAATKPAMPNPISSATPSPACPNSSLWPGRAGPQGNRPLRRRFPAASVDPSGGWRYPHPRSMLVILGQAIEHAWQLTQHPGDGARPQMARRHRDRPPRHILGRQTHRVDPGGLKAGNQHRQGQGPHRNVSTVPKTRRPRRQPRLPRGPARIRRRPPGGFVYFREVLAYYLQHRDGARLLAPPGPDEPLGLMLARSPQKKQ